MSTINVSCVDQVLTYTNMPIISSGGVNADKIKFTFCSLWTGYTKVCVFYRQKGEYYFGVIDGNNEVVIPSQLLVDEGTVNFAVSGYSGTTVRTSSVLSYDIIEGAYTAVTIEDNAYINFTTLVNDVTALKTQITENEVKTNKVTSIGSGSTDTQYPSAKCVYDAIQAMENTTCAYVIDGTLSESANPNVTLDSDVTVNAIESAVSSNNVVILRLAGSTVFSGYQLYALTEYKFGTVQGEWKAKFGSLYGVNSAYAEITKNTNNVLTANRYLLQCVKSDDIVTTVNENSTDVQIPSAKCVYDDLVIIDGEITELNDNLQDVSDTLGLEYTFDGTNIKDKDDNNVTYAQLALLNYLKAKYCRLYYTVDGVKRLYKMQQAKTDDYIIFANFEETKEHIIKVAKSGSSTVITMATKEKVTSISSSSTDSQYPSAKCVYDIVGNIESLLGALL